MDESGIGMEDLRGSIRQVLDEHEGALAHMPDEAGRPLDRSLWTKMADLGWTSLAIDTEYGGLGLGLGHLAVLYEELGRALGGAPLMTTMMAAQAISAWGSASAKARLLPSFADGELTASVAPLDTGPLPLIDGRISGAVDHLPFGADVDLLVLPVLGSDARTALAVVSSDANGVSAEERPTADLTRRMARVVLRDAAAVDLLPVGDGALDGLRDHAAMALACDSIGGAASIFERTLDYLGVRVQFGRPIGSFQALKHRAASWKVLLEAATALTRHAAAALSAGDEGASAMASGAKFYASDIYSAIAGDAVQLHGGIGFTWEHPCHLFLKRAKMNQQLFGSSTDHKERVARLALANAIGDQLADQPLPASELNAV